MPTGDIKMDDQQATDELKEIFFHEAAADGLRLAELLTAFLERKECTVESVTELTVLCNHFSAALFGMCPEAQKIAAGRVAKERPERLDRIAQILGAAMEKRQGLAEEQ
jgi:hypothetical protein